MCIGQGDDGEGMIENQNPKRRGYYRARGGGGGGGGKGNR